MSDKTGDRESTPPSNEGNNPPTEEEYHVLTDLDYMVAMTRSIFTNPQLKHFVIGAFAYDIAQYIVDVRSKEGKPCDEEHSKQMFKGMGQVLAYEHVQWKKYYGDKVNLKKLVRP